MEFRRVGFASRHRARSSVHEGPSRTRDQQAEKWHHEHEKKVISDPIVLRAHLAPPLDALGVLARVAVLHSGWRQLRLAGDSLSRPHAADGGESRHFLRRLRWRI